MKKTLVIFFILVFISAGAFYYFKVYQQKKVDIWQMVPGSAILAYENNNLIEDWNRISDKLVWESLYKIPYFKTWEGSLIAADSLSGKNGLLDKLFRGKPFVISTHKTSSNTFDFLFLLDFRDNGGEAVFDKLMRSLQQDHSIVTKSRTYQGYKLHEVMDKTNQLTFTYLIYENIVAGSFTPFLVEDAVRNIADGFKDTFRSHISALQGVSKLENDEGNIYIDFEKLPDLFTTFLTKDQEEWVRHVTKFAGDTYLDIKVTDNELLLNGLSDADLAGDKNFIGTFRNQNPGRIRVTELLPNNTAMLYHVTFSDFSEWQSQLTKYWSVSNKAQFQRFMDFESKYGLKLDWIEREAANAILETPNKEQPDQLLFVGVSDKDRAFTELSDFAALLNQESGDSVYIEMYNEQPIVQAPIKQFPSLIMGGYFEGFENSYLTIYEDYLVIGNSMQVIKFFLQELENENNWGKSIRQNMFLENTLSEANISIMINTSLCWQLMMGKMNERWQGVFKTYENPLKSFDRLAVQVSNLDQRFYTSIAVGHQKMKTSIARNNRMEKDQSVYTISPLITKPFIVRNHNNNKFEVLVQDSLNILYQISDEGDVFWGDSIQAEIVSEIHQIDYYKNSKLQYLFATANKIHLLDRNGDYVENYPIKMKAGVTLQHLSVIDYDNSKKYRIMAVDDKGDIYLYDKTGKNLEGWTPRSLGGPLVDPGFHIRVKGGDCLIGLQRGGILDVMNRRGEMYPGFPIDLNAQVSSGVFADIGNDFKSTNLISVSDEGEIIIVNLEGEVVRREQLYKPSSESKFRMVPDALGRSFVITRQEYNKISLLNTKGELLMEKNIISSGDLGVQYYNFSSDNQITVVTDREQEFAYVYDKGGNQITFEPLESSHEVALIYSTRKKKYQLYKCFNNNFTVESF